MVTDVPLRKRKAKLEERKKREDFAQWKMGRKRAQNQMGKSGRGKTSNLRDEGGRVRKQGLFCCLQRSGVFGPSFF